MRSYLSPLVTIWYRLTHPVYLRLWRWRGPTTVGVKVIVTDPEGRVLLVKTRYQRMWTLPGGGVHRRETPEDAAARELREETGVRIASEELIFAGLLSNFAEGKSDYIAVYAAAVPAETALAPGIEIAAARFLDQDALPENASPATRRRVASWRDGQLMTGMW